MFLTLYKMNVTEKLKVLLGRVENIVGKGENAGYQHFLLFPQCFQKPSVSGSLNLGLCGKELGMVTSIFSFSHDVFKSSLFHAR